MNASTELDDILDEALEGFGTAATDSRSAPPPAPTPAGPAATADEQRNCSHDEAGASSRLQRHEPSGFDPLRRAGRPGGRAAVKGAPRGVASDVASAHERAPAREDFATSRHADPDSDTLPTKELDDMVANLANLLTELAHSSGEQVGGEEPSDDAAAPSQQTPHAGEGGRFAATLQQMAQAVAHTAGKGGGSAGGQGGGGDDALDGLMKTMNDAMSSPEGSMDGFVENMMAHLLSKAVLYESLKEIGAKYPPWLASNAETLPPEERIRYEQQHECNQRICEHFEKYGDSKFQDLMQLLQEMQALGQPPPEIVDMIHPDDGRDGSFPGALPGGPDPPGCAMQ